jgi:hypothetical protein
MKLIGQGLKLQIYQLPVQPTMPLFLTDNRICAGIGSFAAGWFISTLMRRLP